MSLMAVEPNDTKDDVAHVVRNKDESTESGSCGYFGLLLLRENAGVVPPFIANSIPKTLCGAKQPPYGSGGSNPGEALRAHLGWGDFCIEFVTAVIIVGWTRYPQVGWQTMGDKILTLGEVGYNHIKETSGGRTFGIGLELEASGWTSGFQHIYK